MLCHCLDILVDGVCVCDAWIEMSIWLCYCEMITIEVKSGFLVFQYEGNVGHGGCYIAKGGIVMRGATSACLSGLIHFTSNHHGL